MTVQAGDIYRYDQTDIAQSMRNQINKQTDDSQKAFIQNRQAMLELKTKEIFATWWL